jgi:hypothetical protein
MGAEFLVNIMKKTLPSGQALTGSVVAGSRGHYIAPHNHRAQTV